MKDQSSKEDTDPSEIVATNGPIIFTISTTTTTTTTNPPTLSEIERVIASYHSPFNRV